MNADEILSRALEPLRQPLPSELSLVSSVLARLDHPTPAEHSPRMSLPAPCRPTGRSSARITAAIVVALAIGLFGLFRPVTPLTLAEVTAAVEKEHWAHLVYQDGSETWVCLDDGKLLMKQVRDSQPASYFLRDPATRTEQHYDGLSEIRLCSPEVWVLGRNRNGKIIPLAVDELTFSDEDLSQPQQTPEEERNSLPAFHDFEIVNEPGRRLGHFSHFRRDALGESQITRELWVDLNTKLPVRIRSWEPSAKGTEHVAREGMYHFVKNGPADLYALGVPRIVPIVPQIETREAAKRLISARTWEAIDGARAAVRRFPHRFRILTLEDGTRLTISYVDSGNAHPFQWADDEAAFGESINRYFFADCQDSFRAVPDFAQLVANLEEDWNLPIPVDALAEAFPLTSSTNTQLIDGRRWFVLTRSPSNPPTSRLQVLTASSSDDVRAIGSQWEYAHWNWTELATGRSTESAPPDQILVHAERHDFRNDWFVDPERDYTVARHVESILTRGKWDKRETRALKWERLPEGPWYVSVWETRSLAPGTRNGPEKDAPQEDDEPVEHKRLVITPLTAKEFPEDLFDGDKFLEAARASGAQIRVD